jgi:hypothetical protein
MHDLKTTLVCEGDTAKVTLEVAFNNAMEAIAFNERLAALNRMSAEPNQRGNPLSLMARGLRTLPPSLEGDNQGQPVNGRAS